MMNSFKKIFTSSMIALVFLGGIPSSAKALMIPVAELGPHAAFQDLGKMTLDTVAYTAGQIALSQLTNNTISWIKGGFNGSPSFAIDPNKLFTDLADMVTGGLASQIRSIEMCNFDPNAAVGQFQNDLANALELSTRSNAESKFANQLRCPFSSIIDLRKCDYPISVQANLQNFDARTLAFYQSKYCATINPTQAAGEFYRDFRKGGWHAFESALEDSGNSFGIAMQTSEELNTRVNSLQKIKEMELGWASGFTSFVDTSNCNYPEGATFEGVDASTRKIMDQAYCARSTPGKLVSDQLSKTLGVDADRLGFADNMNKIVAAFVQQLTQQAITGVFK